MPAKRMLSTSNADSGSKKRKLDPAMPKYYAVRAGINPGVYSTWAECQEQTSGFRGASYKSFPTFEDAEAFVAGEEPESPTEPDKFYAVAVGNPAGIYTTWTSASLAIKGVKGPKYKRFASMQEATEFMARFGAAKGAPAGVKVAKPKDASKKAAVAEELPPARDARASRSSVFGKADAAAAAKDVGSIIVVYTDGSSLSNGRIGAAAGIGVWFGPNDSRNLSERLPGPEQTNQRAELMAILRLLQTVANKQSLHVLTDSKYAINCATTWWKSWDKKGWVTASNQPVKNQDLVRAIIAAIADRQKAGGSTTFEHVKGHSNDPGNTAADRLAVSGAKLPPVKGGDGPNPAPAYGGDDDDDDDDDDEDDEEEEEEEDSLEAFVVEGDEEDD